MIDLKEIKKQLKTKFTDDPEACFEALGNILFENARIYNDYVQQRSRHNSLSRQIHAGTISADQASITTNQISTAIIYLIDRINESDLKAGAEKAFLPSTVEPSSNNAAITGNGNIVIQGASGSTINIHTNDSNTSGVNHD